LFFISGSLDVTGEYTVLFTFLGEKELEGKSNTSLSVWKKVRAWVPSFFRPLL
jgi:hypothetical protein